MRPRSSSPGRLLPSAKPGPFLILEHLLLHRLIGAKLGADMKNQSMGLMRAVLRSSKLDEAVLRDADLSRADLEFASLKNTDLTNVSLTGATLGGATLIGVTLIGTDFLGTDVASTRLIAPVGLELAKNFDQARNLDRLLRE